MKFFRKFRGRNNSQNAVEAAPSSVQNFATMQAYDTDARKMPAQSKIFSYRKLISLRRGSLGAAFTKLQQFLHAGEQPELAGAGGYASMS
ncbi:MULTISPECIES: hypothetical protein [unclassified Achromobacter]|uniref:hypothetical protein n=1 Tax=unclassified Achromobacter TaxID=2626865 RepID=UPI001177B871|nr:MULTISPECIES: hypothetical protein [unclassified Achromobacter]